MRETSWQSFVVAVAVSVGAALTGAVPGDTAEIGGNLAASGPPTPTTGAVLPVVLLAATARTPSPPELLARSKRAYENLCAPCHGKDGRGDGEAARFLNPKPRDFTAGKFALVSTWERVPTDEDLFCTISRGMPGSAMPPYGSLPESERWGLVYYVKSFAEAPLVVQPPTDPKGDGQPGTGIIRVPPEPPFTAEVRTGALELYADGCASCHGETGKGDGVQDQRDEKGYPTRPRDLTLGVFKGSANPEDLYRRIIAGMPGTPMPMNDWAYGDDAWRLVHLIRSWSSATPIRPQRFEGLVPYLVHLIRPWSSATAAPSSRPVEECGSPR